MKDKPTKHLTLRDVPDGDVCAQRIDMSDETTREVRHVYRRKLCNDGNHTLVQIIGLQQRERGRAPRVRAQQKNGPVYRAPGILPVLTISGLRANERSGST